MFLHTHPYKPFIPNTSTKLIVGTLPPPRFTTGELLDSDVNFCYGSCHNSLWKYIDAIYGLNLKYDRSQEAIDQRKTFLVENGIGICDIVESAERHKLDASDLGMKNIKLRAMIKYLKQFPKINTLLFIGGNSKNGPEYLFRTYLKAQQIALKVVENEVPRIHEFKIRDENRILKTVSLTSSSGAANISISKLRLYKQLRAKNPNFNTFDFRVQQYREFL